MASGKKVKILAILSIIAILLISISGVSYAYYRQNEIMEDLVNRDVIYEGIFIHGIDVGNLTKEEAKAELQQYINKDNQQKQLVLYYGDSNWILNYEEWGIKANVDQMVEEAYAVGREGTLKERYDLIHKMAKEEITYALNFSYNEEIIDGILTGIDASFNKEVKDATLVRDMGQFNIEPESIGYSLNYDESKASILKMLESQEEGRVRLIVDETLPAMTSQYLGQVNQILGSFYTTFSEGNPGRNMNLQVGASKMNDTLIQPGEIFSLMGSIGPVNSANGYKSAPIIYKGKIVPGVGGGVCQVATTLYNAVLQAELEVVERRNHSMPISYAALGQDATVSGTVVDFKFKNNTGYPLYIESYIQDNKLHAIIYGKETRPVNRFVEYEPIVLETIEPPEQVVVLDETLEPGAEVETITPKKGYRVKLLKHVYVDDKLVDSELVNYSYYVPRAGEKKIGPTPADAIAALPTTPHTASGSEVEEPIAEDVQVEEAVINEEVELNNQVDDSNLEEENSVVEDVYNP